MKTFLLIFCLTALSKAQTANGLLPELEPKPTKQLVQENTDSLLIKELTTLSSFARSVGLTLVAEKAILETPIVPPASDEIMIINYLVAICDVHGWTLEKTRQKKMFLIKSTDIVKQVMIPLSTLSKDKLKDIEKLGYEKVTFNNVIYLRAPHGFQTPEIERPIPLQYTIVVNKFDQELLKETGISIDSMSLLQNKYLSIFSRYRPDQSIAAIDRGTTGLGLGLNFKWRKLASSIITSYTLNLEGTNVTPTLWIEEQTKNILIENRNVEDSRVSVDREEIKAGRKFSIEALGGNYFRVSIQDTQISEENEVTGIAYDSDISLGNRKATLVLNKTEIIKKRTIWGKRNEKKSYYYVISISVAHAKNSKKSKRVTYKNNLFKR